MAKGVVNNYGWWEGQVEIIHDGKTFYTPQLCRTILKPTPQHVNTIVTPPLIAYHAILLTCIFEVE